MSEENEFLRPIDYSEFDFFTVEIGADGVAVVTMNDPDRLNAVGPHNHWQIEDIWLKLARDERIKVIVLTGAGKAFSAGGDIKLMAQRAQTEYGLKYALRVPMNTMRIWDQILLTPQPIIAAVNGDAIGLGTSLFAFCDMSIVAEDARLGDTHVRVGLVTGDGGSVMWPLLVGPQRAKEYLMRGKLLDGKKAEEIGLVNYAFPREAVLDEALKIAREIAGQPVWAVRWSKAAVNKQLKAQVNLIGELSIAYEAMTMLTHDYKAATTAFANKEKPVFKGY
ncbi:MAG TPA: enoyl-CoA hydratase/isomerase family protein [Novosphingobium sp.]|nr:enoyl-CoA hydratase/isomerase family protein [Novosphingobium sp.]HZV10253.1 enoyl-CoA hydratase/isomerase family protein [Novosphingobium sp.]